MGNLNHKNNRMLAIQENWLDNNRACARYVTTQHVSFQRKYASVEHDTKWLQSALCRRMRIVFFPDPTLARDVCVKMNVNVRSTVTGCDVTTVQQQNPGPTSTPPRVASVCQIREASHKNFKKKKKKLVMLTCVDRSTRPIHHTRIQRFSNFIHHHRTICQVNSSRSAQYLCQALISICGISRVPMLSFQCHSDSHRSLLMTSLQKFSKYQILNE